MRKSSELNGRKVKGGSLLEPTIILCKNLDDYLNNSENLEKEFTKKNIFSMAPIIYRIDDLTILDIKNSCYKGKETGVDMAFLGFISSPGEIIWRRDMLLSDDSSKLIGYMEVSKNSSLWSNLIYSEIGDKMNMGFYKLSKKSDRVSKIYSFYNKSLIDRMNTKSSKSIPSI